MASTDIRQVTTTDMLNNVSNYQVESINPDSATGQKETEWINSKASIYFGHYKKVPELKKAIDSLATYVVGKGWDASDSEMQVILDHIRGWGEDTFNSVIWNLFVQKKVYGDAFAEIIRDEDTGTLINLKPLDPGKIKIIANEKGIIKRYEQMDVRGKNGKVIQKFNPSEILHLCNDRIDDEIHGVSVIEACESIIQMKMQVLDDFNTVLHRNVVPVRIIEVDTDNETEISTIKTKYELAIKNKEVLIVPKGTVSISSDAAAQNAIVNPMPFINYLDDFFYRAVGVPKIVSGGSNEFTDAGAKMAYLTFSQFFLREQEELAADLWNQVAIGVKFKSPATIQNDLISDEKKDGNPYQLNQPNEMGLAMHKQ